MAIYIYSKYLEFGNVDPTYRERHFLGDGDPTYLESNYLHKVQERFCELGFEYMIGNINGCFNNKLMSAVFALQKQAMSNYRRKVNLFDDSTEIIEVPISFKGKVNGKFDKETAEELNLWLENNYINSAASPLIKYHKTWMRKDILDAIVKAKHKIKNLGGIFPVNSIACFRNPINATISIGMIKKSLHNTALALDFDEWRGMQNPNNDFYFIESDNDNMHWNVYVRSYDANLKVTEHLFYFFNAVEKKYSIIPINGRFINVTEIFKELHLLPIKRKENWEKQYYLTEWWHFQNTLNSGTWEEEMEKIGYPYEFLNNIGY